MAHRGRDYCGTFCRVTRWILFVLVPITLLLAMTAGCATYAAVAGAPEEFWITAEDIVGALLEDLWAIVDLFL